MRLLFAAFLVLACAAKPPEFIPLDEDPHPRWWSDPLVELDKVCWEEFKDVLNTCDDTGCTLLVPEWEYIRKVCTPATVEFEK